MTDEAKKSERLTTSDIAVTQSAARHEEAVAQHPRESLSDEARAIPLFHDEEANGFRTRWGAIQTGFVDEPRRAVEEADTLVAEVMKRLAEVFSNERTELERQWDRGDQISTEDLRVALRRYRSFFERLLAI